MLLNVESTVMKLKLSLSSVLFLLTLTPATLAQGGKVTTHQIQCDGYFLNYPARVSGIRKFQESWGAGGYVSSVNFQGQLQSQQGTVGLVYERGEGLLLTNPPTSIGILDNTGGKMKIYDGKPSLGAPTQLGEFTCQWRLL